MKKRAQTKATTETRRSLQIEALEARELLAVDASLPLERPSAALERLTAAREFVGPPAPNAVFETISLDAEALDDEPTATLETSEAATNDYAILFFGGAVASANNDAYYQELVDVYGKLTGAFGLAPENVYVLYADGDVTGTSANRLDANGALAVSDMNFATEFGSPVRAAKFAELDQTFAEVAAKMTDDSHLLFLSYDHGYGVSGAATDLADGVVGWGQKISGARVRDAVYRIERGYVTLAFGHCYSGGVLDEFFDPLTGSQIVEYNDATGAARVYTGTASFSGMAATNHYESSWTNEIGGRYEGFIQSFTNGMLYIDDATELFDYAKQSDPYAANDEEYANNAGFWDGSTREHPWRAGEAFDVFNASVYFERDALEPNDSFLVPTALETIEFDQMIELTNLFAEPFAGQDWYKITLPDYAEPDDLLTVVIDASDVASKLVYLRGSARAYPKKIAGTNDYPVTPEYGGVCYLLVESATEGPESVPYDITLSLAPGGNKKLLAAPTIERASASFDAIKVAWNPIADATGYVVAYRPVGADSWLCETVDDATSLTLDGVSGAYEIKVRALCDLSIIRGSVYSSVVLARTAPEQPAFAVAADAVPDARFRRLTITASVPIANWKIDWGDGQTTELVEFSDLIRVGHIYEAATTEKSYVATLTAIDAEGFGADDVYELGEFLVPALDEDPFAV